MYIHWMTGLHPYKEEEEKKAAEVAKALLHIIIPRYGLPSRISLNNGPEFIHRATQKIAAMLGITWKLDCSFHAQSGGRVERMNKTIKEKLAKICQETQLKWPDALNMVLVAVRCAPQRGLLVSPFELLYGRVPNLLKPGDQNSEQMADTVKLEQLQALNTIVQRLQRYVLTQRPHVLVTPTHDIQPGQEVWVKDWKREVLSPKWKGPYTVVMCSLLAVKVAEIKSWIHWSRVKLAAPTQWKVISDPTQPLKLTLHCRRRSLSSSGDTLEAVPLRTGEVKKTPAGVTLEANTHRTSNKNPLPWKLQSRH
ncbi:uncharacterized protein LOC120300254 [Crotalus tigris]|uniref:uncharacterized protein LOC120300254 n=1 Tax=Crotalus tigris TaxID=88082 RepID=UPI00192FB06F|nr:uncharacterized protein LOC120300254 [Crotalus tigris]